MYNYTANTNTGRKMTKFANVVVVSQFAFTELDLAEFNFSMVGRMEFGSGVGID